MDLAQLDPEFTHDLYFYHPPLTCSFPFCLSSGGELPVATTAYFVLSFWQFNEVFLGLILIPVILLIRKEETNSCVCVLSNLEAKEDS